MSKKYIVNGRFFSKKITGVERYAVELLKEVDMLVENGQLTIAIPKDADVPTYKNIKVIRVGRLKNILWEHISFPIYARRNKMIPISLCNVAPLLYPGIVCIHDVKIKARPDFFSWKFRLWYKVLFANAAWRAEKIITVSEFSKKEIIRHMKVKPERIEVVPSSWSHFKMINEDKNALEKYCLQKEKYYFAMSSLEPNKNFNWIAEVAKKYPMYEFAISGSINNRVFSDGLGFDCPKNMKLLGYISDEEAKYLMKNCKAFVFPTFYEGFGLPPLEAIGSGCRSVIISDTEVMHEIYGKCGTYIDPTKYDYNEEMLEIIQDRDKIILDKYTWIKSALMFMKVIG